MPGEQRGRDLCSWSQHCSRCSSGSCQHPLASHPTPAPRNWDQSMYSHVERQGITGSICLQQSQFPLEYIKLTIFFFLDVAFSFFTPLTTFRFVCLWDKERTRTGRKETLICTGIRQERKLLGEWSPGPSSLLQKSFATDALRPVHSVFPKLGVRLSLGL